MYLQHKKKLKLILLQINQTVRNSLHVCKKCYSMTTFLAHKNSKLCLPGSWKLSKSCLLVSFYFLSRLERDWKKTKPFAICMVIVNVLWRSSYLNSRRTFPLLLMTLKGTIMFWVASLFPHSQMEMFGGTNRTLHFHIGQCYTSGAPQRSCPDFRFVRFLYLSLVNFLIHRC